MNPNRFVVLGIAHPRSSWFGNVARWANAAVVPADFLKCVSAEEVRARLASGQRFSALVADAALPSVDRDLIAAAARVGCAVVVVEDGRIERDWRALGAAATLAADFDADALVAALRQHAGPRATARTEPDDAPASTGADALVVTVTGTGGSGVSTAAIAVASGLARARRGAVVLADLCRRAEQAMLHDVGEVAPGLQELAEGHRNGSMAPADVAAATFAVDRGYSLLLGLRRSRLWATVRPRALQAAFESLCSTFDIVVCDTDGDFEGEDDGGSLDVEERNAMARVALQRAHVALVVGVASMKGLHSLAVLLDDVHAAEPGGPVVAVVNRAPRSPRTRAEITSALHALTSASSPDRAVFGPLFLPERGVDDALRRGAPLPAALIEPLAGAVSVIADRPGAHPNRRPARVRPGSVGAWTGP